MALTKDKKREVVQEVSELLTESKLSVLATYTGTDVKAMQTLRRQAKENGTKVKVIKNRLVIKALESNDKFKDIDTGILRGQILYAFNAQDEIAAAQSLANFAKTQPSLAFVGGITADGILVSADDIKALANLPNKEQLRAQLVGTIAAPLSGFVSVVSGNLRGFINILNAKADQVKPA